MAAGATGELRLGLDIGGTAIKAGLLVDGRRHTEASAPTPSSRTVVDVVAAACRLVAGLVKRGEVAITDVPAVGVGVPGRVLGGRVCGAANLSAWDEVPLARLLGEALDRPVLVENDANAAALGEFLAARERDPRLRDMAMLTLGTGLGGALILDGQLHRGAEGWAGEIGHLIVERGGRRCACGQRGCLEQYASATAVIRSYRQRVPDQPVSEARDICQLALAGNEAAAAVLDEAADHLALGLINLVRLVDPAMVVLGGGMAGAGEPFFARVRERLTVHTWSVCDSLPRIQGARLGASAGWIGAASLVDMAGAEGQQEAPSVGALPAQRA